MAEFLFSIDRSLFLFINGTLSNPVFDWLMPILTDLNKQKPVLWLVAAILVWMLWKGDAGTRWGAIALILAIIVSDQLSSQVFKYWFERPRPCHTFSDVILRVSCGSGFSFPSSHAVNNFAGAVVLSFFIPKWTKWFFIFASAVAFSRIYVGVHYPLDVLGGAVIGAVIGGLVVAIVLPVERWFAHRSSSKPAKYY